MTLVELLLMVLLIVILAVLILGMLSIPPRHSPANRTRARFEMSTLAIAVENYNAEYGRMPLANTETNLDVTCGISSTEIRDFKIIGETKLVATNSDLILILMDIDSGVNAGHKLNPKAIKFLNARIVDGTNAPGVSTVDYQYRDSWGNPYIISLDANQDGLVRDGFYAHPNLYANHLPTNLTLTNGYYELHGKVMVWSRGPDGKVDMDVPANSGVNKDNVLSWQ